MKAIQPKFKILSIPDQKNRDEVLQFLESIGRICYKSEDNITAESAPKFCQGLLNSKHWAALEHYRFSFFCSKKAYTEIKESIYWPAPGDTEFPMKSQYLITTMNPERPKGRECLLTCSATALNYIVATPTIRANEQHVLNEIFDVLKTKYPELCQIPAGWI